MSFSGLVRKVLNLALRRFGFEVVASQFLYGWQKNPNSSSSFKDPKLPDGAIAELVADNPKLQELRTKYSNFNTGIMDPFVWTDDLVKETDILHFRGDNAYVWQLRKRNMNQLGYALTTYYLRSIDAFNLFAKLEEDGLFGVYSFDIDNTVVSRDLLDSITEMYFLEKHLDIFERDNLRILDIGAGYGRLAHRMVTALPNISAYLCTDAIPVSSFICDYYLRFRGLENRARVVPMDEVERALGNETVDLAINIQSFPECTVSAIEWWISVIAAYKVTYLFLVIDFDELRTHDEVSFSGVIESYGYGLIAKEPAYRDPVVQNYGINPTYHYLFELSDGASVE